MLYLYDALYNVKEETTIEFLNGLFGISEKKLYHLKNEKASIRGRWYIIDENIKRSELHKFQNSYRCRDEIWREIKGTNGLYQISNYGRVKMFNETYPKGKIVPSRTKLDSRKKQRENLDSWDKHSIKSRRRYIRLNINGQVKEFLISRLVAEHYLGEAYQKDFNPEDYWVIHKNNILYEDYFGNLYFEKKEVAIKNIKKNKKAVLSAICRETGQELGPFTSINRAAKALGCFTIQICNILNKNKENCVSKKYLITYL